MDGERMFQDDTPYLDKHLGTHLKKPLKNILDRDLHIHYLKKQLNTLYFKNEAGTLPFRSRILYQVEVLPETQFFTTGAYSKEEKKPKSNSQRRKKANNKIRT